MIVSRFRWLYGSLFGQLTILSLVFTAIVVAYVLIVPYWTFVSESDPVERTRQFALTEVYTELQKDDPVIDTDSLLSSPTYAAIAENNRRFRFYIENGDAVAQYGGAPRWRNGINFTRHDDVARSLNPSDSCNDVAYWGATFDDDGIPADVRYSDCGGKISYIEISGIDTPIDRASGIKVSDVFEYLWQSGRAVLMSAVGVTLIMFTLLFFTTRSVRRLIGITESFDENVSSHVLPEDGLHSEIVPLVRAVNAMMRRIDSVNEQQTFFLATAAHEMRTPMAILRMRLEELPDSATKNELRGDTRRLSTLADQLLQLISIRDRDELNEQVDLVAELKSVISDRAPMGIQNGVDIEFVAETNALPIKGDPHLLHAAIANLIDNALSFSQRGSLVTVTVDENRRITISDQGPGIPEDAIESIFEPFSKHPPNRNGHGLGLAIVKAAVSLHGGSVRAENRPDGGARFLLEF